MCDDRTVADNTEYLRATTLTRRQFGALSAGAGLGMLLPRAASQHGRRSGQRDLRSPAKERVRKPARGHRKYDDSRPHHYATGPRVDATQLRDARCAHPECD